MLSCDANSDAILRACGSLAYKGRWGNLLLAVGADLNLMTFTRGPMAEESTRAFSYELNITDELIIALQWDNAVDFLKKISRLYARWTILGIGEWSRQSNTDIITTIKNLSPHSQRRVLTAPRLCQMLTPPAVADAASLRTLLSFIAYENFLSGGDSPADNTWTALGDRYYNASASVENCREFPTDYLAQMIGTEYIAPEVQGLIIDCASPISRSFSPHVFDCVVHAEYGDMESIKTRLTDALTFISDASMQARMCVGSSLKVAAVVDTPHSPDAYCGSSVRSLIGRVLLTNLRSSAWTLEELADRIVHEAIHSLLYKIEYWSPLYTDDVAAYNETVKSPWSGRMLALHSYVHACYVWFGLWNFWRKASHLSGCADKYMLRAARGFLGASPLSLIGTNAYFVIAPEVRYAVEQMTSIVADC